MKINQLTMIMNSLPLFLFVCLLACFFICLFAFSGSTCDYLIDQQHFGLFFTYRFYENNNLGISSLPKTNKCSKVTNRRLVRDTVYPFLECTSL